MGNPFDHDDDTEETEVQETAPEKGDDFTPDGEGEQANREEKKANRFKEQLERADAAEAQIGRLNAELAASRVESQRQQRQQTPQEDPYKGRVDDLHTQRDQLDAEWNSKQQAGTLTDDEQKRLRGRSRELDEERIAVLFDKAEARKRANVNPAEERMREVRSQYRDVADNPPAFQWADAKVRLRRAKGEEYSHEMVEEEMNNAREEFGLGKHAGTKNRGRYASAPGGGGRQSSPESRTSTMKMTKELKQMADQMYGDIDDEKKRYQHWVNEHGKDFMEAEKAAGR